MLSDRCLSVPAVSPSCLWRWCIVVKGWMDQDETWHGDRPQHRPHSAKWGLSFPSQKGAQPSIFSRCPLWPNGWMYQDATWYGGRPRLRPHCVKWEPSPLPKGGTQFSPIFRPCLVWPSGDPSQLLLSTCLSYYHLFRKTKREHIPWHTSFLVIYDAQNGTRPAQVLQIWSS